MLWDNDPELTEYYLKLKEEQQKLRYILTELLPKIIVILKKLPEILDAQIFVNEEGRKISNRTYLKNALKERNRDGLSMFHKIYYPTYQDVLVKESDERVRRELSGKNQRDRSK